MNILFFDKEGGFGGSSRSLYFLIKNLDRTHITPFVLSRETGPIADKYRELNVAHDVLEMPIFKPSKRKNPIAFVLFLAKFWAFIKAVRSIGRFIGRHRIDFLHLNHDGFFVYAIVNALLWRRKVVSHMRTMIPVNAFGRMQVRLIHRFSDALIFIGPREVARFHELTGISPDDPKFVVIPNIVETVSVVDPKATPEWLRALQGRFKVLWLGNISISKGADRVVEIARELKRLGRPDIVIIACGEQRNKHSRTDALFEEMQTAIAKEGLENNICLAGFQPQPEILLFESHVLIRLTRENDPWGRDVIEAIANGKPVLATGASSPFMDSEVNGYLFADFDARIFAQKLAFLADDSVSYERICAENGKKGEMFRGDVIARAVLERYVSLRGNG